MTSPRTRVAICISGHLRTWTHTKSNFITQLLSDPSAEVDVYVYTYRQADSIKDGISTINILSDEAIVQLFEDIPVKRLVIVDDTPVISNETEAFLQGVIARKYDAEWVVRGSYNSMLSIHKCNQLRIGLSYDIVMRTRFDVIYDRPILWSQLKLNEKSLLVGFGSTLGSPNDMVGIGISAVMDAYADEFKQVEQIFAEETNPPTSFVMHTVLKSAIERHKLSLGYLQIALIKSDKSIVCHSMTSFGLKSAI